MIFKPVVLVVEWCQSGRKVGTRCSSRLEAPVFKENKYLEDHHHPSQNPPQNWDLKNVAYNYLWLIIVSPIFSPWSSKWNVLTSTAIHCHPWFQDCLEELYPSGRTSERPTVDSRDVFSRVGAGFFFPSILNTPSVFEWIVQIRFEDICQNCGCRRCSMTSYHLRSDDALQVNVQRTAHLRLCVLLLFLLLGGICMFFANSERIEDHYRLQDFFW